MTTPALFVAAHPDDETLAMGVAIAEHVAAGQDVHLLWLTRGEASGVLAEINGVGVLPWWGIQHQPAAEGYAPLDPAGLGAARIAEALVATRCLSAGLPGTLTPHEAGLPDGAVTVPDAQAAILDLADAIAPGGPVRLKGHTHVSELEPHPDHRAAGEALRALAQADPSRFGDVRHYLLPNHWSDPDLTLVAESTDQPANAGIAARAVNACRAFAAWAPPHSFAIGMHSVSSLFNTLMATPKCVYHP